MKAQRFTVVRAPKGSKKKFISRPYKSPKKPESGPSSKPFKRAKTEDQYLPSFEGLSLEETGYISGEERKRKENRKGKQKGKATGKVNF